LEYTYFPNPFFEILHMSSVFMLIYCRYKPTAALGDYEDGEFGGMMIGRGNRSIHRKPAPVPLCPSQLQS
jgi:hypothetical protein